MELGRMHSSPLNSKVVNTKTSSRTETEVGRSPDAPARHYCRESHTDPLLLRRFALRLISERLLRRSCHRFLPPPPRRYFLLATPLVIGLDGGPSAKG